MSIFKNKPRFFIILLIIILGAVYSVFDPLKSSYFPSCPFKSVTGLDCPGCGSQRAIHELLHLNFRKAFEYNALLVLSIPYLLLLMVFNFESVKQRFPKLERILLGWKSVWIITIIVIVFFIFRNF
ncbi:DUF2752 domain-containing protein [Candidatus Kaistella beijingensis]|nr:DUF2752 domain-containing protein [Candidatus Kaistella beijingensis]